MKKLPESKESLDYRKLSDKELLSKFRDFDPVKDLEKFRFFFCFVQGSRRRGKTVIIRDIIYKTRKRYEAVYLFSNTFDMQAPETFDYVPKVNRIKGLDLDALAKIIKEREDIAKLHIEKYGALDNLKETLLIFDDIIGDDSKTNSQIMNSLATRGRHIGLSVFILSQMFSGKGGVGKVMRNNADIIISFYPDNETDRELVCEQYLSFGEGGMRNGMEILRRITLQDNRPFCACVVLPSMIESKWENKVFTYVADPKVPKFKIGNLVEKSVIQQYNEDVKVQNPMIKLRFERPVEHNYVFSLDDV